MRTSPRSLCLALLLASALPPNGTAEPPPRLDSYGDPLPPGVLARLGTLRFRGVRGCLAFSPDGKRLAAATGPDGEHVVLWDAATGRKIREIAGHSKLKRVAFSPDGHRLAISDSHDRCRIVEANTGKQVFAVTGTHGIFSADGKTIVTCQTSPPARIGTWDAATGKGLEPGYGGLYWNPAMAEDGRTVAIAEMDDLTLMKIVNLAYREVVRSFRAPVWGGYPRLSLTRDGKTLARTDANGVRLWDVASGKVLAVWDHQSINGAAVFSLDGKRLAWTGKAKSNEAARLWVAERNGGKPRSLGDPDNYSEPPCFSPDGKRLAVVTSAGALCVRDLASGKAIPTFEAHEKPVIAVRFTADGRHVVTRSDTALFVWEARSGRLWQRNPGPLAKRETLEHLLPDGRLLTFDPDGAAVHLREALTGRITRRFTGARPTPDSPASVPSPGGRSIAIHQRDGLVAVFDVRTGDCKYRLEAKSTRLGMKLSDEGDVLIWRGKADEKGRIVSVYIHRKGSENSQYRQGMRLTDAFAWSFDHRECVSPDGRWLVLGSKSGSLRRWDLTAGKELPPLDEKLWNVWSLHWSPDSRILSASGSTREPNETLYGGPRETRFWDIRRGTRLGLLRVPDSPHLVCFSPDGRTLFAPDRQGVIRFWETATGKERGQLRGHLSSEIGSLAVRADGRMLVSGGRDSQALVWDVAGRAPDGQTHPVRLAPAKLLAAWNALASDDARLAYAAIWELAEDAEGCTAFLRSRLRPIARPKPGEIARWIAALDSEHFAEREKASRALEALEEVASAELRRTLKGKPSLEVRRRIETLLARLEHVPARAILQSLRAIETLEHVGTPAAREMLRELAEGAPTARVTREATAALTRLGEDKSK